MDAKGTSSLLRDLGRKSRELGLSDCGKALWRAWYSDQTLKVGQDFNRERKTGKDVAGSSNSTYKVTSEILNTAVFTTPAGQCKGKITDCSPDCDTFGGQSHAFSERQFSHL